MREVVTIPGGFLIRCRSVSFQTLGGTRTVLQQDFQAIGRCRRLFYGRLGGLPPLQHYVINADDMRLLGIPR